MKDFFEIIGRHIEFFKDILKTFVHKKFEFEEFITQLSEIAIRSLPTTCAAGLFTGAILAIQFQLQLKDYGAESVLGGLATSGTLREVGPILIAFMLAGKVGAYTSAELGTMRVTDQIEAIRCVGVNPMSFLIVPRFLAVTLTSLLLLIFGLGVAVIGGLAAAWFTGDINAIQYLSMIGRFTQLSSLVLALTKAMVFGILMALICCSNGYNTEGGSNGVGRAVRNTAVQSMVAIVVADFTISWLLGALLKMLGLSE